LSPIHARTWLILPAPPFPRQIKVGKQGPAEGGQIDPARSEDFLGQGWILHLFSFPTAITEVPAWDSTKVTPCLQPWGSFLLSPGNLSGIKGKF